MNFGDAIKIFLFLGDIKMKGLADALDYDPSYISKWISGSYLPNRKSTELVLTKSSHFFAEKILESKKDIFWPAYFEGSDVPDRIANYHDLQSFIFKTLMASYNQSDKANSLINEADESDYFVERNTYSSYNLSDIALTIHGTCSNAINKYETLHVISSLPIGELVEVLDSQVKDYCMMFRSSNVHLRYFADLSNQPLKTIQLAFELTTRLRAINPKSNADIYAKPPHMTEFICTEGCYIVYRTNILGRPLYHMINEAKSVSLYADHILYYPFTEDKLLALSAPEETENNLNDLMHVISEVSPLRIYLDNPAILLGIEDISTWPHLEADQTTNPYAAFREAFHQLYHRGKVEIFTSKKQGREFLSTFSLPKEFDFKKLTSHQIKKTTTAICDHCSEDVTFYLIDDDYASKLGFTTDIILGPNMFFYFTSQKDNHSPLNHLIKSEQPDLVSLINQQFELLKSHPNTKKNKPSIVKDYLITYLNLLDI